MPTNKTRNTLIRQWELLKLLPTSGTGKTSRQLSEEIQAEGFKVTKRQVERDLNELWEAFSLDRNDKSPPYGWRWASGASVDLPGLSVAEALSLRLVEDIVKPMLPASILHAMEGRFRQAQRKLDCLTENNRNAQWQMKVRSVSPAPPLLPPEISAEALGTVHDALMDNEQIDVEYIAANAESVKEYRLHPLAVVTRGPVTYLLATAMDYTDIRFYALHRIVSVKRTYEPCRRPKDFDLDAYIASGKMQFGSGQEIRLEALVSEGLARILSETPLSSNQVLKDGRLTATVQNTWQLQWWLLSQADDVIVLEPSDLKTKIHSALSAAVQNYERGSFLTS